MQHIVYFVLFVLLVGYQNCAPSKSTNDSTEFTSADVTLGTFGEDNILGGGTDTGSDGETRLAPFFSAIAGVMYQKYTECSGTPYTYAGWRQLQDDINLFNKLKVGSNYTSFTDIYTDIIELQLVGNETSYEQCLAYMSSDCRIYEKMQASPEMRFDIRPYLSLEEISKAIPSGHGCPSVYTRFSSQ